MTPKAIKALEGYALPGNVRELRNIIEHALIVSEGAVIQPEHLRFQFAHVDVSSFLGVGNSTASPLSPPVEEMFVEQEQIRRTLVTNRGNITKTARQLELTRQALYRRLKKCGGDKALPRVHLNIYRYTFRTEEIVQLTDFPIGRNNSPDWSVHALSVSLKGSIATYWGQIKTEEK